EGIDARTAEGRTQFRFAPVRTPRQAFPKTPVVGIDEYLLAGLGVLHHDESEDREFLLEGAEERERQGLLVVREMAERLVPARRADEVRDQENERAALDHLAGHLQEGRQIRRRRTAELGTRKQRIEDMQDMRAADPGGNHGVQAAAEEQRTDAIAVAGE